MNLKAAAHGIANVAVWSPIQVLIMHSVV